MEQTTLLDPQMEIKEEDSQEESKEDLDPLKKEEYSFFDPAQFKFMRVLHAKFRPIREWVQSLNNWENDVLFWFTMIIMILQMGVGSIFFYKGITEHRVWLTIVGLLFILWHISSSYNTMNRLKILEGWYQSNEKQGG